MNPDPLPIREILSRVLPTYLRVLPEGLEIKPGHIVSSLEAEILNWGMARTLYRDRKPFCRSLDGLRALKENRDCVSCSTRKACTPQVRLDLIHPAGVFRLLLAYTSMRNFLLFTDGFPNEKRSGEGLRILVTVVNRGRWGEIRFRMATEPAESKAAKAPHKTSRGLSPRQP